MNLLVRIALVVTLLLSAAVLITHTVMAQGAGAAVPGWGYGDQNHVHTGPPGQSVHP